LIVFGGYGGHHKTKDVKKCPNEKKPPGTIVIEHLEGGRKLTYRF
jgi:hypothetical protein